MDEWSARTRAPHLSFECQETGLDHSGGGAGYCYGALLYAFTNAYAPFVDSAILVFSIIAQLLLMQRRLETWAFWLLVNTIAVPLYFSRGLHLTAFLYAAYWINAVISWRWWQRHTAAPAIALP